MPLIVDPATFTAFGVTSLVLVANLIFLWMGSGFARKKTGHAASPEDAAKFGTSYAAADPELVARFLRAHSNAQANILPFLLLGLVYTLTGAASFAATIIFTVFAAARWLHSYTYLAGKQPSRSIVFVLGLAAEVALMMAIIIRLASSHA